MSEIAAKIEIAPDGVSIRCTGDWTIHGITEIQHQVEKLTTIENLQHVQASGIVHMDTSGAWLLFSLIERASLENKLAKLLGLDPDQQILYDLVTHEEHVISSRPRAPKSTKNILYLLGKQVIDKWVNCFNFVTFFGELVVILLRQCKRPAKFNWQAIFVAIEQNGFYALPIVALLSFLIGVVLAYQMGLQLEMYDANIYIVDLSGLAILREFAPLITAIIAAGRTSTAFTSQIGSMKINEEIDALQTMGIDPIERLVLPKVIGLIIALPLLTVWADMFGIFGSMVMAKNMLAVNYYDYLSRFHEVISTKTYVVGLVKAPVFAFVIAAVGCFQGFRVERSSDSVGKMTTRSAVQSIFLIIILDAVFSIIFSMEGI
ncbi:MAG: ABC transporter permease [Coxiellaceae bacterium]|nr:ABC transporter permease [Coxiellaceae bacterium]